MAMTVHFINAPKVDWRLDFMFSWEREKLMPGLL
jgi:hypothetical protein